MDEPIACGVGFVQRCAQAGGAGEFVFEPVRVDGGGVTGLQDAHADRGCGVVQTDGEKAALVVEDDGQVTGRAFVALLGDGLIEDPGMPLPQGAFGGRTDA